MGTLRAVTSLSGPQEAASPESAGPVALPPPPFPTGATKLTPPTLTVCGTPPPQMGTF